MKTYLDALHLANVKIGDKMLRRDGNGGEKDTWEQFEVNWTYWELILALYPTAPPEKQ